MSSTVACATLEDPVSERKCLPVRPVTGMMYQQSPLGALVTCPEVFSLTL